jgi:signal transduction histidine kinase
MKTTKQEAAPERRRKILVDKKTQRALAVRMIFHCLIFMVAGGLMASVHQYLSNPFKDRAELFSNLTSSFYAYACAFLVLLPALVYDSLKLSNRVVGPICRLRDTMKRLAQGEDVEPMKFRPRDYWQDVPPVFNQLADRVRCSQEEPEESHEPEDALVAH